MEENGASARAPALTSPHSSPPASGDLLEEILWALGAARQDQAETRPEITVGRADAIQTIQSLIARGRHALITGPAGAGKSHLLRYAAGELAGDNAIRLDDFKAPKSLLVTMGLELHEAGHLARYQDEFDPDKVNSQLNRLRVGELMEVVAASLRGRGYVILIDNLETMNQASVPIVQALTECATLVAACKSAKLDRITAVVDRFNRVELGPMPDDEITALLWTRLDRAGVAAPAMLERRVIAQANGLPGVVVDAAHKLAGSASRDDIRQVSPTLPARAQIDLTLIIFMAFAGLIAMRYIARATDSTTAYIAFGALSALGVILRMVLPRLIK